MLGIYGWAHGAADGRRRRLRPAAAAERRRSWRWLTMADAAIARAIAEAGDAARRTPITACHHTTTGLSNNKLGDVAVPRVGVPAVRRPDLDLHALPRAPLREPRPRPGLGHPVHVGIELHPADVVADDGARRLRRQAPRRPQHQAVAVRHRAARLAVRRPARSTSSPRSTARVSASRPACSARASTRSPASTACTCRSASSCCCRWWA